MPLIPLPAWLRGMLLALLLCACGEAQAGCAAASGNGSFGSPSSRIVAGSEQATTATSGLRCTGSVLSVLSTNTITARITGVTNSSGSQLYLRDPVSRDRIGFILCQTASCAATYAVGGQIIWSGTSLLGLLGLFNASDGSLPLYLRTIAGTQVTAGTYEATISIAWQWHLCSIGVGGGCLYEDGSTTSSVAVRLVVEKDCAITAPAVNFGSAAFAAGLDAVTQSLVIRCSKGAGYTVGIGDGQHFGAGSRQMSNGAIGPAAASIPYEIYFPAAGAARWGSGGSQRHGPAEATTGAGMLTGAADQIFTYQARILPGGAAVGAGRYSDMLTVDVAF